MALLTPAAARASRMRAPAVPVLVLALAALSSQAWADHGEYVVKAAFLVNFARLVEWPATAFDAPDSPLEVGILGSDRHLDDLLRALAGKEVGGRELHCRRIQSARQSAGLHLVFVSESASDRLSDLLAATAGDPVLLVGESENFARDGGSINFFMERDRIRFEVNPVAVERAGLRLSSRLLRLARIVGGDAG